MFCFPEMLFSQVTELTEPINIAGINERDPFLSNDSREFYFINNKDGWWKIYQSTYSDGRWTDPKPLDSINNFGSQPIELQSPVLSNDGQTLYFSANYTNSLGGFDIYFSHRIGSNWSKPENVGTTVNTSVDEQSPSISPDNKSLFFTRPNPIQLPKTTLKYKQLWISKIDEIGVWQTAVKLPAAVNRECEDAPRMSYDNRTLYFSSLRQGGRGGLDIYCSRLITNNIWSFPLRIDTANALTNEVYACFNFESDKMLFNKNNSNLLTSKNNVLTSSIYSVPVTSFYLPDTSAVIEGTITDFATKKPVQAEILIRDITNSQIFGRFKNNTEDGKYYLIIPSNRQYEIDIHANNYSHNISVFKPKNTNFKNKLLKDVQLFSTVQYKLKIYDSELFNSLTASFIIISNGKDSIKPKIENPNIGHYFIELALGNNYKILVKKSLFEDPILEIDLTKPIQFYEFNQEVALIPKRRNIEISINDNLSQRPINVKIEINNVNKSEQYLFNEVNENQFINKNSNGKYSVQLREGNLYKLVIVNDSYFEFTDNIDLLKDLTINKVNISLVTISPASVFQLKNISFESGSNQLKNSSLPELNLLAQCIEINNSFKYEIGILYDNSTNNSVNARLAGKRAEAIIDYLCSKNCKRELLIPNVSIMQATTNQINKTIIETEQIEIKVLENK